MTHAEIIRSIEINCKTIRDLNMEEKKLEARVEFLRKQRDKIVCLCKHIHGRHHGETGGFCMVDDCPCTMFDEA